MNVVKHELDDIADDGEDAGNELAQYIECYMPDDSRVECLKLLDRLLADLGLAVGWHSGLHFEPDFDLNAKEN